MTRSQIYTLHHLELKFLWMIIPTSDFQPSSFCAHFSATVVMWFKSSTPLRKCSWEKEAEEEFPQRSYSLLEIQITLKTWILSLKVWKTFQMYMIDIINNKIELFSNIFNFEVLAIETNVSAIQMLINSIIWIFN